MSISQPDLDALLRSSRERHNIPAVVAAVGTSQGEIYSGAFGTRDPESGIPVTTASIFPIASMTKAIASAAAMQLVERGALQLDEPASRLLPELSALHVLQGFDPAGHPNLRPAARPVTLRNLLTHTSGFAYDTWNAAICRYTAAGHDASLTLAFEPDETWQYGPGTYWVGRLVEAASGLNLEDYLQLHFFRPLGMYDTSYELPPEKFPRLVSRYQRERNGALQPLLHAMPEGPAVYRGDGRLYSTAPDYLRFMRMILQQGVAPDGARILSAETVAAISTNATGAMPAGRITTSKPARSCHADFHPGHESRHTLAFVTNPEPMPGRRSAGSLWWGGVYNTYYWIDPARDICGLVLMSFLPFADPAALALFHDFEYAIYAALS